MIAVFVIFYGVMTFMSQIESAVSRLGTERLKPLRESLPRHITYRMIRFVVADLQRAAGLGPDTGDKSGE